MRDRAEITLPPSPDYALKVKMTYRKGWSQKFFISSDVHSDSDECYIKLVHKHYAQAKAENAYIIDNGDFFDVIGGAGDKRATKSAVIEELSKVDYLDRLVEWGTEEFKPYVDNFLYCGTGNHEASVLKRAETDITKRWVSEMNRLRSPGLTPIYRAGYTGWIRFAFENVTAGGRSSLFLKAEHGNGGSSPVTKGIIQASRRGVRTQGATFFVSGHIHSEYSTPQIVERPNLSTGRIEQHKTQHIQIGSYKADFRLDGAATWAMMTCGSPAPIGGIWLEFYCANGSDVLWRTYQSEVDYPNLQSYLRDKARILRKRAI